MLGSHENPSVAVVGGAKVADKIGVISNLLDGVDRVLIGGGMVAAFLRAGGMQSGAAKLDDAELETAGALLRKHGDKIGIPTDVTVASEFNADAIASVKTADNVAGEDLILDIGPDTAAAYAGEIGRAKTVLWNGPMGVAEWETVQPRNNDGRECGIVQFRGRFGCRRRFHGGSSFQAWAGTENHPRFYRRRSLAGVSRRSSPARRGGVERMTT